MPILLIWVIFRLLASAIVTFGSHLSPVTSLEQTIPILPPSQPLSAWFERFFLSPWLRWDVSWYQRIIEQGYSSIDGTAQFHPLYPGIASLVYSIDINPLFSLLLVSSVACFLFLLVYHRLACLDLSPANASFSLILFLLFPAAFIMFAPYSEALFLLCAASSFLFARYQRWLLAGLAGGMAVLTRQQGILLLFPLALEFWQTSGRSWLQVKKAWKTGLSLSPIPLCMALWLAYRYFVLNDQILNFKGFHNFVYSFFISPSANHIVPEQAFIWPWQALWLSIQKFIRLPDLDIWINLTLAGWFLILLILSWKDLRPAFRFYAILIILVSFSYYTGPVHPYMGLPRHLLLAFPVFIAAAPRLNRPPWTWLFAILFSIIYIVIILVYSLGIWVP